jgi:hypothetical protein
VAARALEREADKHPTITAVLHDTVAGGSDGAVPIDCVRTELGHGVAGIAEG